MEYAGFRDTLLKGNRKDASGIIRHMMDSKPVEEIYEGVIRPALYDIGTLWENNRISVATEHMATAITEGIMNEIFPEIISSDRKSRKVVLTSVEGEPHQVGARMVGDLFEINGWDAYYVGSDTPVKELLSFIDEIKPDIIGLSMTVYFNLPALEKTIRAIREKYSDTEIMVGGQGFIHGGAGLIEKYDRVVLIKDLHELDEYIKEKRYYTGVSFAE
ncbi:MAG: cobalamin-dependent protein [Bacteroidales bacterium]